MLSLVQLLENVEKTNKRLPIVKKSSFHLLWTLVQTNLRHGTTFFFFVIFSFSDIRRIDLRVILHGTTIVLRSTLGLLRFFFSHFDSRTHSRSLSEIQGISVIARLVSIRNI